MHDPAKRTRELLRAPLLHPPADFVGPQFAATSQGSKRETRSLEIIGSWSDFKDRHTLVKKDDTFSATLLLPPGKLEYQVYRNGQLASEKKYTLRSLCTALVRASLFFLFPMPAPVIAQQQRTVTRDVHVRVHFCRVHGRHHTGWVGLQYSVATCRVPRLASSWLSCS
jgi:hypothetical protein